MIYLDINSKILINYAGFNLFEAKILYQFNSLELKFVCSELRRDYNYFNLMCDKT